MELLKTIKITMILKFIIKYLYKKINYIYLIKII